MVAIAPPLALGNKGGMITLVDAAGLKVDGVAYTKEQASNEGWTIVFCEGDRVRAMSCTVANANVPLQDG